jgi:glycosyltransferase 2 family protein
MLPWWLRAAITVLVAAILLAFVPIGQVWTAIRAVDARVWAAAVVVFSCGHVLNSLKLRVLLGSEASAAACVRAHFAGMAANLGLPGVAGGEVVRVAALAPAVGTARVALAAVADRIVDAVALTSLVVGAVSVAGLPSVLAGPVRRAGTVLLLVVVALAVAVAVGRRRLQRTRAWPAVGDACAGLLTRPGALGLALVMSLLVQITFVLTNVWLASEVGVRLALAPWFLGWAGSKLSALLPISLGGLGVRDATLVSILAAYGAPPEGALAVGLLWEGAIVAGTVSGFLLTQVGRR